VCQYAILLMMVAQSCNMVPGELVHMIADAHIYDRHVEIVRELISRPTHPAPRVSLNPNVTDFYAFTTDDLVVEGYEHGPQVTNIPIAV
jgi:thymidylate synthase